MAEVDKTNLIAHWRMDEASGNALDIHGTNHLTHTNNPASVPGWVRMGGVGSQTTGTARDFVPVSGQFFSTPSSALFQCGDIGFTFVVWIKPRSTTGLQVILGKDQITGGREYLLYIENGRVKATISTTGTAAGATTVIDNESVPIALNTWHMIAFCHNPDQNNISLEINGQSEVLRTCFGWNVCW